MITVDCLDYDFYGEGDCSSARELKVFPFRLAVRLSHRLSTTRRRTILPPSALISQLFSDLIGPSLY